MPATAVGAGARAAGVRAGAGAKSCVLPESYTWRRRPTPSGRLALPLTPAAAAASGPLLPAGAAAVLTHAAWPAAGAAASPRPVALCPGVAGAAHAGRGGGMR